MDTIRQLDFGITIDYQYSLAEMQGVLDKLKDLGFHNLADLLASYFSKEGYLNKILTQLGCRDLKDLHKEVCIDNIIGNTEDMVYAYDTVDKSDFESATSDLDNFFTSFLQDTVRHKLGYTLLSEEDIDYIRNEYHRIMSDYNLE